MKNLLIYSNFNKLLTFAAATEMADSVKNILKTHIVRNVGKLFSANLIAQAIGLLIYPVLTRIYSQADFGLFNVFMSIAGVLIIFSTGQYQHAIPLPKEDKRALDIFNTGFLLLLLTTLLTVLLLPAFCRLQPLLNAEGLERYVWLLPVLVFANGLWTMLNNWFIRKERFTHISVYQVCQNSLSAIGRWILGVLKVTGGLIYGAVLAPCISLAGMFPASRKTGIRILRNCSKKDILSAAKEYSAFPKYQLPRALVNLLNTSMAIWFISPAFGLETVGYWGMAFLLALTPIQTITDSLYQVLFQYNAKRCQDNLPLLPSYRKFIFIALATVTPLFIGLYFCLPAVVRLLLGNNWGETAHIIRYLLPWILMICLAAPWNFTPNLFNKQNYGLIFEIAYLVSRLLVCIIGVVTNDFRILLLGYSLTGVVIIGAQTVWYYTLFRQHDKTATK